jgi:hypothetical protein
MNVQLESIALQDQENLTIALLETTALSEVHMKLLAQLDITMTMQMQVLILIALNAMSTSTVLPRE